MISGADLGHSNWENIPRAKSWRAYDTHRTTILHRRTGKGRSIGSARPLTIISDHRNSSVKPEVFREVPAKTVFKFGNIHAELLIACPIDA